MPTTSRIRFTLTLVYLALPAPAPAQDVDCPEHFDVLVARVQENYAGYHIEVVGRRDAEYAAMVARTRSAARGAASVEDCIHVLRRYTGWFADPHLFIGQFPAYDSARLAEFAGRIERMELTRDAAIERLRDRRDVRDPLEGIWYDGAAEIAVLPDPGGASGQLIGVVVSSTSDARQVGDVIARFTRDGEGGHRVVLRLEDGSPRFPRVELYKEGLLLRLAPHAWGRRFPLLPHQEGLLHPDDPRAPAMEERGDGVLVLSIPSHDPRYRPALEELVKRHQAALERSRLLLVDLRGNEGGSSGTTRILRPYYVGAERPGADSTRDAEERPVVLASPANLRAFQRWKEWYDPDPEWLLALLRDLENRTGELVSFPSGDEARPETPSPAANGPRRFAVLVDGGVVSAGEAFVLEVRRYARPRIYGQPTGGSIDYQNVQILSLAEGEEGLVVGYPTLAASPRLPEGGWNATGIPPDVPIDPGVADPIGRVVAAETE